MEKDYYLAFSQCLGIGPKRFEMLLKQFGSAKAAFLATNPEIRELFGQYIAGVFSKFKNEFDPALAKAELEEKNIVFIEQNSDVYPTYLKQISDPPIGLYVRGDIGSFDSEEALYFSIVGTRRPTSYGIQIAKRFAKELTDCGFVIVSGMALGIDAQAHIGCLDGNGKTIAVLGCGVDVVYPAVNKDLYERILKSQGLVVSEFPPGHLVSPGLFVARNRIVSGISKGVLVVEGAKDSGALITARYAAKQGKDVFATPAPITSEVSEAPNILLKQGAKLVTSIDDILEEFHIERHKAGNASFKALKNISSDEAEIRKLLMNEPMYIDDIARVSQKQVSDISKTVSVMEIKSLIQKNSEGKYETVT